ncbi:MAG: hypothetical protein RL065_163 [Bacteroidota bacterium]|jgi:LysM repeat protein
MKVYKKLFFVLAVLQLFVVSAFAYDIKKDSAFTDPENSAVFSTISSIEISYNDEVQNYSEFYQAAENKNAKRVLERGHDYFQMIENIFNEEGLPIELKYLAYVESNYNPRAMSRAGARGMWQFMRGTAITYGLKVNRQVDERLNPEKSTRAAAAYFKKLYNQYNNWHLAIAAYNCGEGLIDYAINKANGVNDFWEINKYLPRETRNYVPHFLGLMDAMNGYSAQQELNTYLTNNGASTPAASSAQASVAENATNSFIENKPEVVFSKKIKHDEVEANKASAIAPAVIASESDNYLKEYFVYIIKQGDSIESIAKRYPKNSISIIKDNNNLSSNADLSMGSTLLLEK